MHPIVGWLFAMMVAFAPPEKASYDFAGHDETVEARTARYVSIAEDVYAVAFDPDIEPLYAGPKGRQRTALLVLAIAFHESAFAHDVDVGPCYRGRDGQNARCDHGRSACIMQIHVGEGKTPEGYTQADLFADRKKCLRSAIARSRSSLGECKHLDEKHRLNAYASGVCTRGDAQSEELADLVAKFAAKVKAPPEDDASYMPGAEAKAPSKPAGDASKKAPPKPAGDKSKKAPPPSRRAPRHQAHPNRPRSVAVGR
jgi:hypothetical protein